MHRVVLSGNGEIAVRLGAALLIGGAVGLNRDLYGKPAGMRTHGLVSLGAAVATIVSLGFPSESQSMDPNAINRVLQGILTGIGFFGAGVILRDPSQPRLTQLGSLASSDSKYITGEMLRIAGGLR
jgi:putative Mg2+ transporter-C (MgtC) family protein